MSAVRYVAYLRVSTDQQADTGHGLDVQEEACRAWRAQNRGRLIGVFRDAGRSGAADLSHRPGLAAALAALVDDRADGLLVYRLDRLARDVILQEQLLADLHRLGKELRSCSPTEDANLAHDPDDPTRALVRRILGSIATYEREMIRLRLNAGRSRKQLAGGYVGGAPPYGYAAVRKELVPVPSEQAGLKVIRKMAREGKPYRQIAAELERRGIASRAAGGKWQPGTIWGIIKREEARKAVRRNGVHHSPELEEATA